MNRNREAQPQTAEEMQAAARRILERQAKRPERHRRARKGVSVSPVLPEWLTPEKLAYHQSVMQAREAEHLAEQAAQKAKEKAALEAQRAREQAALEAQAERLRVQAEQQRRHEAIQDSLIHLGTQPLTDELAQGLYDGSWSIDQANKEALVQGLYQARLTRLFTELEQQYFARAALQTQTPLPYLEKHPFLLVEPLYPRLEAEAQLFANLSGLLRGQPVENRLLQQLRTHLETLLPFLLRAAGTNLPLVERLPWQVQYRVAVTWLAAGHAGLSSVKWHDRVATALAVGQATAPQQARAALDALFDDVAAAAYDTTDPLDFTPLVPSCRVAGVACTHCEGRPWKSDTAFCPTLGRGCPLPGKAWIQANSSLPPSQWSVLELLHHAGFQPRDLYPELPSDADLASRLGGWLNRLNKIRSRMRCRSCTQMMRPNKKYARFLAKYPVTVFQCEAHPVNVKLTQCWLCDDLIDSRDSRFFDGGSTYNICLGCGGGEQARATVGRRCPQCGAGPMKVLGGTLVCGQGSCGHRITLTPKRKGFLAPELV